MQIRGAWQEILQERAEAMQVLELLCLHLRQPPFASEWAFWIPRENNQAADFLAARAIECKKDSAHLHGNWLQERSRYIVGMSDAGVKKVAAGAHVGMGWLLVDRESHQIIAAAQWYRWVDRREQESEDVNLWEMRAAKACLAAVMALRVARLHEVMAAECPELPAEDKCILNSKLCCSQGWIC